MSEPLPTTSEELLAAYAGGRRSFEWLKLKGSALGGARLAQIVLAHGDLRGSALVRVDLTGASLKYARLDDADLRGAALDGANLGGLFCRRADFSKASLREARLGMVVAKEADFREADLTGASLKYATLTRANFSGADLRGAKLFCAEVKGANFAEAELGGVSLGLNLSGCSFVDARLRKVRMDYATLKGTDFTGADLRGVRLRMSTLKRVDFTGADLRQSTWSLSECPGVVFRDADLRGVGLGGRDLRYTDLRGTDLRGAELKESRLKGAVFDDRTRWPEGFDPLAAGALVGSLEALEAREAKLSKISDERPEGLFEQQLPVQDQLHPQGQAQLFEEPTQGWWRTLLSLGKGRRRQGSLSWDPMGLRVSGDDGEVLVDVPFGPGLLIHLNAWPGKDGQVELEVRLLASSQATAQQIARWRVLLPQTHVSLAVPVQQTRGPWMDPGDFGRLWPLLLVREVFQAGDERLLGLVRLEALGLG